MNFFNGLKPLLLSPDYPLYSIVWAIHLSILDIIVKRYQCAQLYSCATNVMKIHHMMVFTKKFIVF